jgi:hypothetical protein
LSNVHRSQLSIILFPLQTQKWTLALQSLGASGKIKINNPMDGHITFSGDKNNSLIFGVELYELQYQPIEKN